DPRETLRVALTHDVWGVVAVGCDPASNERTLEAARSLPKAIWACVGFHPEHRLTDEDLERVEAQVREHRGRIVALGEVGLPWYGLPGQDEAGERRAQGGARPGGCAAGGHPGGSA